MSARDRPVQPTAEVHVDKSTSAEVTPEPNNSTPAGVTPEPNNSTPAGVTAKSDNSTPAGVPVTQGSSTPAEVTVTPGSSTPAEVPVTQGSSTPAEVPVTPGSSIPAVITADSSRLQKGNQPVGGDWKHIYCAIFAAAIMSNTLWAVGGFFACWVFSYYPSNRNVTDWDMEATLQQMEQRFQKIHEMTKEEYDRKLREIDQYNLTELNRTKNQCMAKLSETLGNLTQLKTETEKANRIMSDKLDETTTKFKAESENTFAFVQQLKQDVTKADVKIEAQKQETDSLEKSVKETPLVMALYGYLTLDTIGPLLFIVPAVEFLVLVVLYHFLTQSRPKVDSRQEETPVQMYPRTEKAPVQLVPHGDNVAVICFRDKFKAKAQKWAEDLVQGDRGLRLDTAHVVDALGDLDHIPPCTAALVFADPDGRNMIIEDERHHIGLDLRRQTVQRLMDSKVEVFIIIFQDKGSSALPTGQLFNKNLGQVDVHPILTQFKREERIVSIKDTFTAWQKEHLLKQLRKVFP